MQGIRAISTILLACLGVVAVANAHEIPNDVTIQIIVKPSGDRLELLVRAPLEAMQDINFPTHGPGFLDIPAAERQLRDAARLWLANDIDVYENGRRLRQASLVTARASIPSDRSFRAYASALEHLRSPPLPASTELVWQQALLDVLFEMPVESEQSTFALDAGVERLGLRVVTVIRFIAPDGVERLFQIEDYEGVVELDPSWFQAAFRFVKLGFEHILDGIDHLLFLFCLVIPFRRDLHALVVIVTAFTVAHSVTLIASAYGLAPDTLWFPPLVEVLIAVTIFYMAVENVVAPNLRTRWGIAFGFGLVHGFGFSFALRNTLQFAGDHILTSLLAFNVGVELGQLLVLLLLIPALNALFKHVIPAKIGGIIAAVLVAHIAWHWMADRYAVLKAYPLGWADAYAAFAASGLPWLALGLLIAAAAAWVLARRGMLAWVRPSTHRKP